MFHLLEVGFTKTGEITLNAIRWWASRCEESIFLVTNRNNAYQVCRCYRCRFRIDTFFSDKKSRGFHIHKNHLSDPARLSRMLISACLAYIWMICQGLQVIASNKTTWIDRTERIDKNFFRLGLGWIKYTLNHHLDFRLPSYFLPLEALIDVQ